MAKQIECRITGRMEEYSFYHDRLHGYLVRHTGGVTAKQYHTDPRYADARDASSEFAIVSSTGKLIRDALSPLIKQVKDGTMVNRMNKELVALKQQDDIHPRGKRRPEVAMTNPDVNQWFRIFQFNENVKTYELLENSPVIGTGIRVDALKLRSSAFPENATHAGLTLVRTGIDFEKREFNTSCSLMMITSRENQEEISLIIEDLTAMNGIEIICLRVVFFCEGNGRLIPLKGKVHSMGIIGVNECKVATKFKNVKRSGFCKSILLRPDIRYVSQNKFNKQKVLKNHPT